MSQWVSARARVGSSPPAEVGRPRVFRPEHMSARDPNRFAFARVRPRNTCYGNSTRYLVLYLYTYL